MSSPLSASVIIPTYGRPRSLPNCLASLEQQTVLPKEVIVVVDGGITPDVQAVIDEFISHRKLSLIQINNTVRMGAQVSRSTGLAKATGDIVTYLDDDITLEPDWLAQLLSCYTDEAVAGAGGRLVDPVPFLDNWWYRFFSRLRNKVLRSKIGKLNFIGLPYAELTSSADRCLSVDYLNAGNGSYRRDVLVSHKPDVIMALNFDEETNLGTILTRKENRKLIFNPKAVAYHHTTRSGGTWDSDRMYNIIRDHTTCLMKNYSQKYLRLAAYALYVVFLAVVFRAPRYLKAVNEGIRQYRRWSAVKTGP